MRRRARKQAVVPARNRLLTRAALIAALVKIMEIIDTHQHLWDLEQFPYSWTPSRPALNRSFKLNDYYEATRDLAISKSVHVEADVDEDFMLEETLHVLSLARDDDNPISGVVAAARPEYDDFRERINRIAGHRLLKGVRRILHTEADELSATTTFVENVKSLEDYGLTFDICVLARQLPRAINLVEQCPNVNFILDHCGNPNLRSDAEEKEFEQWRERLQEISAFPNVACKVSGIVVNTDLTAPAKWNEETLRPAVEHVIACFGWDRVMFGSDWPVCTLAASFKEWAETLLSLTRESGEENQRRLFYENAIRVYKLS
ncbi:MAG TPA: amidohydrolase [Blastocatellia bacterium]|nr:amidohydrolase [Blastocatellia bacterium]